MTHTTTTPKTNGESVYAAYARRARQLQHLIKAAREGLDVLEGELAASDDDVYPHGWDQVGDMAVLADALIEAVAALRQDTRDDLEPELLGN